MSSVIISPVWDEDVTILVQAVPFSIIVIEKLCLIEISEKTNSESKLINQVLILQHVVTISIVRLWNNFA